MRALHPPIDSSLNSRSAIYCCAGPLPGGAGTVVLLTAGLLADVEIRPAQDPTAACANEVHASGSPSAAFANARSRGGPDSASAFNPFANTRLASIAFLQPC